MSGCAFNCSQWKHFCCEKGVQSHTGANHIPSLITCKKCDLQFFSLEIAHIHWEQMHGKIEKKDVTKPSSEEIVNLKESIQKNDDTSVSLFEDRSLKKTNCILPTVRCPKCEKTFNSKSSITSHYLMAHNKLTCEVCKKEIQNHRFRAHINRHKKTGNFGGDEPNKPKKVKNQKPKLEQDLMMADQNPPTCQKCTKVFRSERLMKHHGLHCKMSQNNKEISDGTVDKDADVVEESTKGIFYPFIKSNKCPICGKSSVNRIGVVRHYKTMHLKNSFPCKMCSFKYARKDHLKEHWILAHKHKAWPYDMDNEDVANMGAVASDTTTKKTAQRNGGLKMAYVKSLADVQVDNQKRTDELYDSQDKPLDLSTRTKTISVVDLTLT